jgi:hypothetical protein
VKRDGEVLAFFHVVVKMYRYSLEDQVFIVRPIGLLVPLRIAHRRFVGQFGGRNPPSKRYIQRLVEKLETKGTWQMEARNVGKYRSSLNIACGFSVPHKRVFWEFT